MPAEEDPFGRGRVQLSSWVVWEVEGELRGFERGGGCSGDSGRILRGQGCERDTGRWDLTWDPRRETGSPRHGEERGRGNIPRGNGDSGTHGAEEGRRRPVGGKGDLVVVPFERESRPEKIRLERHLVSFLSDQGVSMLRRMDKRSKRHVRRPHVRRWTNV